MRSGNEPRKGGRPALSSERKKSQTLTFRTRADLRKSLEAAAEQAGRSISEEVEYRLQRSFDRGAVALEMYGSQHAKLIRSFNKVLSMASGARQVRGGNELSDNFILIAVVMLLAYSGRGIWTLLDDEVRQKNAEIAATAEIADAMEIEPSSARRRVRSALKSFRD
jgi:hypothetical protein